MAKKIPVLMNLEKGAVVIDYEIHKGTETGLYHVKAKTGTTLLYTEEEIKDKVKAGAASRNEEKEDVTLADLID
tara:strand:- start:247 stop:468 length:222 start_codon:yes stop_codon:yes gene_type:complete